MSHSGKIGKYFLGDQKQKPSSIYKKNFDKKREAFQMDDAKHPFLAKFLSQKNTGGGEEEK